MRGRDGLAACIEFTRAVWRNLCCVPKSGPFVFLACGQRLAPRRREDAVHWPHASKLLAPLSKIGAAPLSVGRRRSCPVVFTEHKIIQGASKTRGLERDQRQPS